MTWDQEAWFKSLDHPLTPIWKYITHGGSATDCECIVSESQNGIAGVYVPQLQTFAHIDSPQDESHHPFEDEPGLRAEWRNGKWYNTAALIQQQRQWFIWRWRTRDVLTLEYCAHRLVSKRPPDVAYARILEHDFANHPALEEQIPLGRMEAEYQHRLTHFHMGGPAPHLHELKDGPEPTAEPPMPTWAEMEPPDEWTIAARHRHLRWLQREGQIHSLVVDLARTFDQDFDPSKKEHVETIRMTGDGIGERHLLLDYGGRFGAADLAQINAALDIHVGKIVSVTG